MLSRACMHHMHVYVLHAAQGSLLTAIACQYPCDVLAVLAFSQLSLWHSH